MTDEQKDKIWNVLSDNTNLHSESITEIVDEIVLVLSTPSDKSMSDLSLYDRMFAMVSYVAGTNDADVINGYTQTFVAIADEHATNQVAKATAEMRKENEELKISRGKISNEWIRSLEDLQSAINKIAELEANQPKWISTKPEPQECILLCGYFMPEFGYDAYIIKKTQADEHHWYWGIFTPDGDEWGDIADLQAELYLILPIPKP